MCAATFKRLLKFARKGGLKGAIKKTTEGVRRKTKRKAPKRSKSARRGGKRKLRAGIHRVRINGKMRKVRVLNNGRWRFMKG